MESRIIRITDETVSWAKQIESTAGTLGELKRELDNAGINYSGKELCLRMTRVFFLTL